MQFPRIIIPGFKNINSSKSSSGSPSGELNSSDKHKQSLGRRSLRSSEKSKRKKESGKGSSDERRNEEEKLLENSALHKSEYQEQMSRISEQCESQNSNNILNKYTSKDTIKEQINR